MANPDANNKVNHDPEVILKEMSTIYSAGQFDDAFSPKRLGNWEARAKNPCHSLEPKQLYPGGPTQVIVDEKGHLLPGVPRNRATAWGLLQYYMKNRSVSNMATMSGQGKQRQSNSSVDKRVKKLPRHIQKKSRCTSHQHQPEDLLLDYLKELRLPVVWIVGPATKKIFHKRKQFAKQLAGSLRFGYVNLDEKIQEWKDRQSTCTCSATQLKTKPGTSSSSITCIAPSKLPTNVPPHLSASLPSPRPHSAGPVISELLDTQRISFDAALPIERNKILELYKFALAECLPCEGFVCDSVPFDLVEGLAFEKAFYPAALAIYFAEGAPHKKLIKPKDRRLASTIAESCKNILAPMEYLERCKHPRGTQQGYLRTKSHKRLGNFSIMEAEKICRQFGSKTIRIINAEEVERDTMDFLNELVKKNLLKYQQILAGNATLDCSVTGCGRNYFRLSSTSTLTAGPGVSASRASTHYSYASSFIPEGLEEDEDKANLRRCNNETVCLVPAAEPGTAKLSNLPQTQTPATGKSSQTSLSMFPFPNIFRTPTSQTRQSSVSIPPPSTTATRRERYVKEPDEPSRFLDEAGGGAGDFIPPNPNANDNSPSRQQSSEILEKINKLENKVAELNPEDGNAGLREIEVPLNEEGRQYIPPPTAYAVEDEVETLTSVIRRAIAQQSMSGSGAYNQQQNYPPERNDPIQNYDLGASGDSPNVNPNQTVLQRQEEKPRKEDQPDPSEDMSYFEEQFSLLETDLKRKQEGCRKERSRHDEADASQDPNADPFFDT